MEFSDYFVRATLGVAIPVLLVAAVLLAKEIRYHLKTHRKSNFSGGAQGTYDFIVVMLVSFLGLVEFIVLALLAYLVKRACVTWML